MRNFEYKSKFAPYIVSFLKEKEQKGLLKSDSLKGLMLEIDRFLFEYNVEDLNIKEELIELWKETRVTDSKRTLYHRFTAWVHFCKYLNDIGIDAYIPRTPKDGRKNNYIPYIYNTEEINLFFSSIDTLRARNNFKSTILFFLPVLFRLLYSTGMRIGEAISLKCEDIDLVNQIIFVNNTKNGYQRICAINNSLLAVLNQYKEERSKLSIELTNRESLFFTNSRGHKADKTNINIWFHKILYIANIPKQIYFNMPRIHDFRHTAAVHSLEKMVREGRDIYSALPILSAFLGHRDIYSTEGYLRLTLEMHPDLIEKSGNVSSAIFPKLPYMNRKNDFYE